MTANTCDEPATPTVPTLAEDLLLLLFQPDSATIAGENTLFYVLGGAVLADLALHERVTTTTTRGGRVTVEAIEGRKPADELLRPAWDYIAEKPRGVQTVLAAIGPALRQPVLDRLIARGDIREEKRRILGVIPSTALVDGGTARRSGLLRDVRDVLVDDAAPTPPIAALWHLSGAAAHCLGSIPRSRGTRPSSPAQGNSKRGTGAQRPPARRSHARWPRSSSTPSSSPPPSSHSTNSTVAKPLSPASRRFE